ncbi:MAG: hypothetical protein HZC02_04965 [Candidatus Levybacteria bacterium]|nr:hypothetical protein [Candidatus Levybacteria bacterium]
MAGPSSPDQRPISGADMLVHGRTKEIGTVTVAAGVEDPTAKAIQRGNELAAIKAERGGGEVLAGLESQKRRSFDLSRQTALRTRFGAGRAEVGDGGKIVLNKDGLGVDAASVESNSKSAERVIGQVSSVLNYTEVILEAQKTGKTPEAVMKDKKIKKPEWSDLRSSALNAIIDTDAIRSLMPDLDQLSDKAEQLKFIENALAKDPAFHSKIAEKMIAAEARTREFTSAASDGELDVHQETSKASKEAMAASARDAVDKMVTAGLSIPDADAQAQAIQKMLETGTNPDQITAQILAAVRSQQMAARPDMAIVENFYVAKAKYDALLPRMKGIKSLPATAQTRLQDEFDKADAALTTTETQFTSLADPVASEQALVALNGLLSAKSENGIYNSPIAQDLAGGVAARKRLTESEQAYKKKAASGREKESDARAQRLAEESDVITDMESILSESIGEVLSDRLQEMRSLDVLRRQKDEQALEETGKKDEAEALKKLGTAVESNWSKLDMKDRKRTIDRAQIGADVRILAYKGQEGLRNLIRRDLVKGGQFSLDGALVDVNTMTPEQTEKMEALIDSVLQQEGQNYARRLFADFIEARQLGNSRSKDIELTGTLKNLGLKDHEWDLLAKNFEGMITPHSQSSGGAELMAQLQKEGIDIKGKGGSFLLSLLFMLLGTVGVASAAAFKKTP